MYKRRVTNGRQVELHAVRVGVPFCPVTGTVARLTTMVT